MFEVLWHDNLVRSPSTGRPVSHPTNQRQTTVCTFLKQAVVDAQSIIYARPIRIGGRVAMGPERFLLKMPQPRLGAINLHTVHAKLSTSFFYIECWSSIQWHANQRAASLPTKLRENFHRHKHAALTFIQCVTAGASCEDQFWIVSMRPAFYFLMVEKREFYNFKLKELQNACLQNKSIKKGQVFDDF